MTTSLRRSTLLHFDDPKARDKSTTPAPIVRQKISIPRNLLDVLEKTKAAKYGICPCGVASE